MHGSEREAAASEPSTPPAKGVGSRPLNAWVAR